MRLYIFNPEHEIALAHGSPFFTAPRAGRLLRSDLGFLPALWAMGDDIVWTDSPQKALEATCKLGVEVPPRLFADTRMIKRVVNQVDGVEPWGWDAAIHQELLRLGVRKEVMPTDEELERIRFISHRRQVNVLLEMMRLTNLKNKIVGECIEINNEADLLYQLNLRTKVVLKAPWSCSGRGVRLVTTPIDSVVYHWAKGIIPSQGSIMLEPWYDKATNFGMEFFFDDTGIHYQGLSLFNTNKTAYTGNIIASEEAKRSFLAQQISPKLIDEVCEAILFVFPQCFPNFYYGPFGIDMMVVKDKNDKKFIHPCVEINFRRTMGHVAIDLQKRHLRKKHAMKIAFEGGHYHLNLL